MVRMESPPARPTAISSRCANVKHRPTTERIYPYADKVAVRRSYEGTHTRELLGIPATGKRFHFGGISIFRLANGWIAEHWEQLDRLALMQQLGVVAGPEARSASTG